MSNKNISRKNFLNASKGLAVYTALGGFKASAAGYKKNDTISVGLIGCGGRCRGPLMRALKRIPNTQINAVCDIYTGFLNSAHVIAGGRKRDVMKTDEYRKILDRKDIDAVVIATPDHWHAKMTMDACEAGKDVYVEKPATHDLEEGKKLIKTVRKTKRVVQVGAQQRTMPHLAALKKKIESKELDLGPVHRIHMQWNRNHTPFWPAIPKIKESEVDWNKFLGTAKKRPYDPYVYRNWRWMWDFGNGPLCDLMVHWLDFTNWLLSLPMPKRITSLGGNYTTKNHWETPDTIHTIFTYPKLKLTIDFAATFSNDHEAGSMRIMSEKASIYIDRARYEVTKQKGGQGQKDEMIDQMSLSDGPRGMGNYNADYDAAGLHITDWLNGIRTRKDPTDYIESAVHAADVAHYGNIAYKEKRMVEIG